MDNKNFNEENFNKVKVNSEVSNTKVSLKCNESDTKYDTNPNKSTKRIGEVIKCVMLNVRSEPNLSSSIIARLDEHTKVEIEYEKNNFYKVYSESGIDGYVCKDYVKV